MDPSDADTSVQTAQTASADQQPQASQPQRSRTTVVCGECKRLKLKCDRRQPCASCSKRDTVPKCLYSASAVEKLDMHSLNNRLMHIETFTMTYTNGRFQPAYASANHPSSQAVHSLMANYACQSTPQHPGGYHQHHHHPAILNHNVMAETFSNTFQSLIPTCLGDLGFVQNPTSSTQGDIKPEPSLTDNGFFEQRPVPFSNSRCMSKSKLRQLLRDQRTAAHTMLPSITVYYSATPSNPVSPVPQDKVPQVTPGLLSCLPPLATCQRLLQSAGDFFRVSPLPFDPSYGSGHGWKGLERRCLQFLNNTGKEKRSGSVAKRARDIYPAGPSQPPLNESSLLDVGGSVGYRANPPNEGDAGHHSSLTFFAMTCAALAIGAVSSLSEGDGALVPSSAAFFYTLSQQALGVWDTHTSSSSKRSTTKGDAEQIEYLFACLLSVVYLLQSGTVAAGSPDKVGDDIQEEDTETGEEQDEDSQIVSSLVGKMTTVARNIHLDKETTWTKRKKKKSSNRDRSRDEWKRMVWWEIVFYDLFIADALGQTPHISLGPYNTNFPSCAIFSHSKSEGEKLVSADDPHVTGQERGVQNLDPTPLHHNQSTINAFDEQAYFGARYQLTRVAQAVRSRNSLPECCCGYTLDQAVALENQVREWQDALPAFLKISGDDETQATTASSIPNALPVEEALKRLQAYELAIVSNVLVVNVYMPFLSTNGDAGTKSRFQNLPAASACIHAAQAIVHLANGLQSLLSYPSISSLFSSKVMPMMFQFIPLEKLVFDAVVVCAHAAFSGKSPSMAFSTGTMADDASLGLKLLRKLGPPLLSSVIERDGDDDFQNKVINLLYLRLVQRNSRLKRKLDDQTSGDPQDFNQSVSDALATNHSLDHQTVSQQDIPTQQHHRFVMDSLSSPSSTLESDHSGSQSPSSARQPSRPNRGPKSLSKEKGKKGVKKHPAVGLRLREGHSVHPASRSNPPPLAKAEDVWKFERSLQVRMGPVLTTSSPSMDGQTMPVISPIATSGGSFAGAGRRSRSSSTSRVHPQPVDSLRFGTSLSQSPDEMGMPPRKRLVLQDIREHQLQPQSTPFAPHSFDHGHRQTQQQPDYNQLMSPNTFDGQCPNVGMDPSAYRVTPSTQSPYLNTISVPEHTTTYDPHIPLSSVAQPTTYFSSPTSYGSAYAEQLLSPNVIGLHTPISGTSAVVDSQPPMMSVPNTPVYEQSSQQHHQLVEDYSPHPHAHHMQHPYHHELVPGQPQPSVGMYDCSSGNSAVTGILGW